MNPKPLVDTGLIQEALECFQGEFWLFISLRESVYFMQVGNLMGIEFSVIFLITL